MAPAGHRLREPCRRGTTLLSAPANFSFPFFVLDNWLLQATLSIPISDYFLRIDQNYTAATHSQEAARWDVVTARAASEANGRIAYYTWLNARGAVIVAVQALNDQKTHLRDARNQFAAGNASKADVLRAETAMASAELALERAKNLADLSEKQLRVAMHAPEGEALTPGENLDAAVPPVQGNLKQMTLEALSSRPEIKSADANAAAAHEHASAAKAQRWPVLSAFGDGILGNPNPRYIPPTNVWNTTWDLGAQVTWSPNDVLTANGNIHDLESRVAAIEANKNVTRDNIEVEVHADAPGRARGRLLDRVEHARAGERRGGVPRAAGALQQRSRHVDHARRRRVGPDARAPRSPQREGGGPHGAHPAGARARPGREAGAIGTWISSRRRRRRSRSCRTSRRRG